MPGRICVGKIKGARERWIIGIYAPAQEGRARTLFWEWIRVIREFVEGIAAVWGCDWNAVSDPQKDRSSAGECDSVWGGGGAKICVRRWWERYGNARRSLDRHGRGRKECYRETRGMGKGERGDCMIDPTAEMPAVTETGLASMEKAVDQYETLQLRTLRMQERILATQDRYFFVEHC